MYYEIKCRIPVMEDRVCSTQRSLQRARLFILLIVVLLRRPLFKKKSFCFVVVHIKYYFFVVLEINGQKTTKKQRGRIAIRIS